jgi:hypothetical protein
MARSAAIYDAAIDALKVETNPAYQPSGGTTYCNVFAQDVMKSSTLNASLPTGNCSSMLSSLTGNNFKPWYSVDYKEAQNRANSGYPTIGITSDHIVVVRPNGGTAITELKQVTIAQAGAVCYNKKTINYAWTAAALPNVKFYSYYD